MRVHIMQIVNMYYSSANTETGFKKSEACGFLFFISLDETTGPIIIDFCQPKKQNCVSYLEVWERSWADGVIEDYSFY